MINPKKIYLCHVCGNMVELIKEGGGGLVCCGQPMELLKENATDAVKEKHVPVIEKNDNGVTVKIGAMPHPMEDAHYIEWIEIISVSGQMRIFLRPGDKPEASFSVKDEKISVRAYCNLHGLWRADS